MAIKTYSVKMVADENILTIRGPANSIQDAMSKAEQYCKAHGWNLNEIIVVGVDNKNNTVTK